MYPDTVISKCITAIFVCSQHIKNGSSNFQIISYVYNTCLTAKKCCPYFWSFRQFSNWQKQRNSATKFYGWTMITLQITYIHWRQQWGRRIVSQILSWMYTKLVTSYRRAIFHRLSVAWLAPHVKQKWEAMENSQTYMTHVFKPSCKYWQCMYNNTYSDGNEYTRMTLWMKCRPFRRYRYIILLNAGGIIKLFLTKILTPVPLTH